MKIVHIFCIVLLVGGQLQGMQLDDSQELEMTNYTGRSEKENTPIDIRSQNRQPSTTNQQRFQRGLRDNGPRRFTASSHSEETSFLEEIIKLLL